MALAEMAKVAVCGTWIFIQFLFFEL